MKDREKDRKRYSYLIAVCITPRCVCVCLPEAVVCLRVSELRESVLQLFLHCVCFTPQFAVDANVPAFIEHQVISAVVQHTQVLHTRQLHAT